MKWTTWKNIGVDRMACIWLVRRHIDRNATFHFVEPGSAPGAGQGTTFDMPGARFSHRGPRSTFHTLLNEHRLDDPVLLRLARILDEADVAQEVCLEPAAAGLDLVCRALRRTASDDHAAVERALLLYDAVYAELNAAETKGDSP